jgi:protein TonB
MPSRKHFTISFIISLALHALVFAVVLFVLEPAQPKLPNVTPVRIVDLPQQEARKLPPMQPPAPVPPSPPVPERFIPEKPLPPGAVPMPKKFGAGEEVTLPKTLPRTGIPEGAEQGTDTGKTGVHRHQETGPLPFLTQNDIDELARKGMPAKKPGDNSVTLDTDEFKFISYNRWLKVKVESGLHYPELAALSGLQGTLYILFDIMKDGSLGRLELLKSSGYKILDDEALRAIRDSAPFQPLPNEWNMERYSIRAAVLFYLGAGYFR